MDLLTLCHQCVSRERIVVFSADQRADTADTRRHDFQAGPISAGPTQFLIKRRHKFAMAIEQFAAVRDQDVAVPQASLAVRRNFRNPHAYEYAMFSRSFRYRCHLRAINTNRVVSEPSKHRMTIDGANESIP